MAQKENHKEKMKRRSSSYKVYIKTLAREHELHPNTYLAIMEQYDVFLVDKYNITVKGLLGYPLMPWQVDLLRRLNPTDFQINTMKELGEYAEWQDWLSGVLKICSNIKK